MRNIKKLIDKGGLAALMDEQTEADMVNHPPHYTGGGIECIEAIKAALSPEEFRGFCKGNAFKYVWRHNHKGKPQEQIEKAKWYLNRIDSNG